LKIEDYIAQLASNVNSYIHYNLPDEDGELKNLASSMRYSMLNGGKRIRPVLVLMFNELAGAPTKNALPAALAIELIHTYSLIHDDLPSMDDGQERRGKPTNHRVFGEDLALLAGDGLLTLAFEILARNYSTVKNASALVLELATSAGYDGMVGGQVTDIGKGHALETIEDLKKLHRRKTGKLIRCACRMGILTGEGNQALMDFATFYGEGIGLLFQIIDDILDVEGDPIILGKTTGRDHALNKLTFVSLLGKEGARREAQQLSEEMQQACEAIPNAQRLADLVSYLLNRKK
jgi:geranylgeranyl diphosphate synthase, type II